jgi:NAD-dependent DNA ligase
MVDPQNMTMEEKYILARWCYSISEEFITDAEYNNLHRMFVAEERLPEYTGRSWSSDPCPYDLLKKYGMEDKARTIVLSDKTDSIEALTNEADLEKYYRYLLNLVFISYKHDGWNIQLTYHNGVLVHAQTRGRKSDSVDIWKLKGIFPQTVTKMGKVRIIGEITLTFENFRKLKEMYPEKDLQSQRASVSSAIANEPAWSLLSFTAFDIFADDNKDLPASYIFYLLSSWGFEIPTYRTAENYEQLLKAIKELSDSAPYYPHLTDGLVIRSNEGRDLRAVRILNWEEPIFKSYVMGYEEETAAHSRSVKIKIYPIRLQNSTQSVVPITNLRRIVNNHLEPGAPIAFKFTSAAIADIDEDVTAMLQHMYRGNYTEYKYLIEHEEYVKDRSQLR